MLALPDSLDPLVAAAREWLRAGWRPSYDTGPSRDELVDTLRGVAPVA